MHPAGLAGAGHAACAAAFRRPASRLRPSAGWCHPRRRHGRSLPPARRLAACRMPGHRLPGLPVWRSHLRLAVVLRACYDFTRRRRITPEDFIPDGFWQL